MWSPESAFVPCALFLVTSQVVDLTVFCFISLISTQGGLRDYHYKPSAYNNMVFLFQYSSSILFNVLH
jgi:hypothetical protein